MKKNPIPVEDQDFTVRLKPVFGIKPGHYLTVLYGAVLLLLLYWVFLHPGVSRGGEFVRFESPAGAAAVYVDGEYRGSLPDEVFVPAGDRTVTISKPGFEPLVLNQRFSRRLFASRFFPKRRTMTVNLSPGADFDQAVEAALLDHNTWGMVGNFSERYQYPPVLSALAESVAVSGSPAAGALLKDAVRNLGTPEMLRDYLNARGIVASGGGIATPASLVALAGELAAEVESHPNLVLWGAALLGEENASSAAGLFSRYQSARSGALGSYVAVPPAPGESLTVSGAVFREIPAGYGLAGEGDLVYVADIPTFYIMDREVTNALFADFLKASPDWAEPAGDYLKEFDPDTAPDLPVSYVTWYAAVAYCEWLEAELGGVYDVRLPSESEWYRASSGYGAGNFGLTDGPLAAGETPASPQGLFDMAGNLWEWCDNGYHPGDFAFGSWESGALPETTTLPAAERAVRGGSWANRSVTPETRAAQPPESATPYLGFRPVLIPRVVN